MAWHMIGMAAAGWVLLGTGLFLVWTVVKPE
jgi:hypothetical protein